MSSSSIRWCNVRAPQNNLWSALRKSDVTLNGLMLSAKCSAFWSLTGPYAPKQHLPTGQALGGSHVLHYVIVPGGTLDQYYEEHAQMIASDPKQLFGEFVYEGEIKVQVSPEQLRDQDQADRIHKIVLAWQESSNKELELTNALLPACRKKFNEGCGPSGWQICEYLGVLGEAKVENSRSRSESELPSTPEQIKHTILQVTGMAIAKRGDEITFDLLKMAYNSLARFLPDSKAGILTARNLGWLSEDPDHPSLREYPQAAKMEAEVDAEEDRLAEEFDKLVAEQKEDLKSEEKLEWFRNEKAKVNEELAWLRNEQASINREKIKLELKMAKAFLDLNPDSPETVTEDPLEEFRGSNAREGTSAKYCGDALIAWRQGDRETAFQLFTKAVELDSDDGVALLNRGNLQLEMGWFEGGMAVSNGLVKSPPNCLARTRTS